MSSSWNADKLDSQTELMFQFKAEGRKNPLSQFKAKRSSVLLVGGSAFLSYSRPH